MFVKWERGAGIKYYWHISVPIFSLSLPSSKITFSDYSLVFKGEENKSLKKSLGVHRIGKEVSGHFYKEFEARNTQKKQSAWGQPINNWREFREYFWTLFISCIECMRDRWRTWVSFWKLSMCHRFISVRFYGLLCRILETQAKF